MGSPIDSWDGAEAIFTGAGNFTSGLFLVLAVVACFGAIVYGMYQEEAAHKKHK
ncbi:MAG: hypothetical protein AAFR93_13425 [Pseudomonadota bacterium]